MSFRGGGGGFRTGGSSGGFRSGGFSSGGFRSSGSGFRTSSSRNNNSGHRTYNHRTMHSHSSHYYSPYYNRRRSYYGRSRSSSICQGLCCCFLITIFMVSMFIGFIGDSWDDDGSDYLSEDNFEISGGFSRMVVIPKGIEKIDVTLTAGSVKTYFFNDLPEVTGYDTIEIVESNTLSYYQYQYYTTYLEPNSFIDIEFEFYNSDSYSSYYFSDFYIIKGERNFNDFANDYYFSWEYNSYNQAEHTYYPSEADIYYFIFYNDYYDSVTYDANFTLSVPLYEMDSAIDSIEGNFQTDISAEYEYMLIVSTTSTSQNAQGAYTLNTPSSISAEGILGIIFIIGIIIGAIVIINKKKKDRSKSKSKKNPQNSYSIPNSSTITTPSPSTDKPHKIAYSIPQKPTSSKSTYRSTSQATYKPQNNDSFKTLNEYQVKKLRNMFNMSNRIKVDDVARVLHITRNDLLDYLIAHPEFIQGFKIDGDYFQAKQNGDINDFITGLDQEFEDWKDNEKTGHGKTVAKKGEFDLKFCELCGNIIDPSSKERLKDNGYVFCMNCGHRIENK